MKVGDYEVQEGFYYSKTHEWLKVEGNIVTTGIDDYAQQQMGEITFVDFRNDAGELAIGTEVSAAGKIAEMESHKAVEDVFTGVTGKVHEVNQELADFPAQINEEPYGKGWFLKIEATNLEEDLKNLMTPEQYAEFIKE